MKKFQESDIFISTLKVYPKVKFFGYSGSIFHNNTLETNIKLNDFLPIPISFPETPSGALLTETEEPLLTEDGEYIVIE